jgi:hypothetical protein
MSDIKLTDDLIKIITEKINKTGETITSDVIQTRSRTQKMQSDHWTFPKSKRI